MKIRVKGKLGGDHKKENDVVSHYATICYPVQHLSEAVRNGNNPRNMMHDNALSIGLVLDGKVLNVNVMSLFCGVTYRKPHVVFTQQSVVIFRVSKFKKYIMKVICVLCCNNHS